MIAALLASFLLVSPARAATAIGARVVELPPAAAPVSALSAPAPLLSAAPFLAAPSFQSFSPAPAFLAPASAAAAPPPPPPAALQAAPAASIPEGDGSRGGSAAPEAAARPSSSPSSRIGAVLRRLANPFGTRSAEPVRAPSEAARLDREFSKLDLWSSVGPAAKSEIEGLRARKLAKAQTRAYVRREVNAAFARVMAARGTGNLGFHFNLHGGAREGYVGAGIRASKGDIALRYSTNGDFNDKVYFFQTSAHDAYTALDASNGELLFFPSRMGYALSVFAVDAPELRAARADGRIDNLGSISMDFHKGMRGVPYSAFLAPPSEVFVRTARKVGLKRLSRDEETLATARYLEAVLRAGGAFVPR